MQIVSFECDAYRTPSVSMLKCHQVKHYGVYVMYNEDILRIIHAEERCNGVQNIYITVIGLQLQLDRMHILSLQP